MSSWQGLVLAVVVFMASAAVTAEVTKVTLKVEGMTQTGCSSPPAIRGTMKGFPGVRSAEVSLERGEATVEYEPGQLDLEKLIVTVERMCLVKITRPPDR